MPSPFPGMDPWLEHHALWPDVHNRLIAAIGDELAPVLRPRYYAAIEERLYRDDPADLVLVGRADVSVVGRRTVGETVQAASHSLAVDVEVPVPDDVRETYLEVRSVADGEVVTVLEVLSPKNKRPGDGRRAYLDKRQAILATATSLVEIDLLRTGERMPLVRGQRESDYAILVCRSWRRPHAELYPFSLRDAIPPVPVPLRRSEAEPVLELGGVLARLYDRAGYDLRVDYRTPPDPPLPAADVAWAAGQLGT